MDSVNNLLKIISQYSLNSGSETSIPPVEKWDPDFCGDMDLLLKTNGEWIHDGKSITRKKLIILFSKILKKENEQYFLVTPVEKIGVQVEWQPFVIIDFEIIQHNNKNCYVFTDNCDNTFILENKDQLKLSKYQNQLMPIVKVRRDLYASFNRSSYYRLIEKSEEVNEDAKKHFQIFSAGIQFCIGKIEE